jgi:polysaccharide deacetylase family protein (PEP-CTERM system associated)
MLTFDIEDWFQVETFKNIFPIEKWNEQNLRIDEGTNKILDLLRKYNIKATFFILAWIAKKNPRLVKKIYKEGHEISSHGYSHKLNYNMSKKELYNDLKNSKEILESIIKDKVIGYRAPTFSINDELITTLIEIGYEYDSSLNQFSKHGTYGNLKYTKMKKMNDNMIFRYDNKIIEISLPVIKVFEKEIPFTGGGFFRLYPLWLTKKLLQKHFQTNNYYIFYAHPWELDPDQPIVRNIKLFSKFRHYINIRKNYQKIESFINYLQFYEVEFVTIRKYLDICGING